VRQQESGVDQIVLGVILELLDIRRVKLDVVQAVAVRVLSSELHLDVVLIDAVDAPRWPYKARHRQADVPGPAAEVQTAHASREAGGDQQPLGGGPHRPGNDAHSRSPVFASPNHVARAHLTSLSATALPVIGLTLNHPQRRTVIPDRR
jgi:hypothetical protein